MAKREKDFESQVDAYMALHKCSKTQAMQAITKKDPDAHQAYLEKFNTRKPAVKNSVDNLSTTANILPQIETGPGKDFMTQVEQYAAMHGCSKTQAMQVVLKKDLDSHREYIRQTQKK